ncbi:DinB family protein [Roseivirga sp.]|uniref:DinB family protein n=1 Tax=Roseivirga sp. TaxID=1964215 RepID=UPI002B275A71|nr:DinB family protein [Roseivirga sp.]
MTISTQKYLDGVINDLEEAMTKVERLTENLDEKTLNQPEAEGKWSMLQCVEHITLATAIYVKNFSEKLDGQQLPAAVDNYKGHWKGRMFAKMNAPKPEGEIPMKLKTFKFLEPKSQLNSQSVLAEFRQVHEQMISLVENSRMVNIDRIKVPTALGSMVKLRLGEALRFIIAHTQRHLVQLERIKKVVQ